MKSSFVQFFIGELRLPAGVPALLQHITLQDDSSLHQPNYRLPLWGQYPVVGALMKIGQPAVAGVIGVLGRSDDALTRRLCLDVLKGIEQDSAVVRLILKNSIVHETNAVTISRIQSAIDSIKG